MTPYLLFALALVLIAVGLLPLIRQRLQAEGLAWAKEAEDRKLYDAVSGKVLVRNFGGFDIYPSGVVPEGTAVVMDRSPEQIYGMLLERSSVLRTDLRYPIDGDSVTVDVYYGRHWVEPVMPYRPRHVFITGVT